MKVALAVSDNMVTEHFGHCDKFVVYEINDKKIIGTETIQNRPHQRGFLPNFLRGNGINCVITGNIGEIASKILDQFGIIIYKGVHGTAPEIIAKYLEGTLESTNQECSNHEHHERHNQR